ncbi:aromatic-ring-hydroxylating dioxygenase subunit beta [Caballeronia temeraria]|uniref:Aromatic-ring-hydroxylating dioxygenase subunit beta n=1 Tax=Caballeronia temeraria TaxID=1777137 RepID=A0A158DCU3_9BURK|nr:anthranilate 1,2-dioxygenase small subunit AndAd [Caballeronia temeraria]SAK92056.1 aromatic-ring-hydroxylating dioxygenase subunit beta [Caballeronia temeraria]
MDEKLKTWLEIYSLAHQYISSLDNDRLEDWPNFFTPDCHYEIIPRENHDAGLRASVIYCTNQKMLRDRVVSLRHANIYEKHTYRHAISGLVIGDEKDGEITSSCSYIVVLTNQAGESAVYQSGAYHDTVVRLNGALKYSKKVAVYDTLRVQTLLATPI